ncbi:hypothetical protein VUR80DRAFT_5471 [Thermomyces stellatus]
MVGLEKQGAARRWLDVGIARLWPWLGIGRWRFGVAAGTWMVRGQVYVLVSDPGSRPCPARLRDNIRLPGTPRRIGLSYASPTSHGRDTTRGSTGHQLLSIFFSWSPRSGRTPRGTTIHTRCGKRWAARSKSISAAGQQTTCGTILTDVEYIL